jgi:hypothetical protein
VLHRYQSLGAHLGLQYQVINTLSCFSFRILKSDELKDEVYEVDTDADQVDEVRKHM